VARRLAKVERTWWPGRRRQLRSGRIVSRSCDRSGPG